MSVIAVDFDGVIHDKDHPIKGRRMGGPLDGAREALERLSEAGHRIIVHTVMATTTRGKEAVQDWMSYYSIPYWLVTATKPNAHVFIDDKAIRHISWGNTLSQLEDHIGIENG